MKVYCEKCHEDLSSYVDRKIIGFIPGTIQCPKCQKKQSRYISNSDLLLLFGLSELTYLLILLLTIYFYDHTNLSYYTILVLIPFLILIIFIIVNIGRYIFLKAPFKKAFKDLDFHEDPKSISKSFNYRIIVFASLSLAIVANEDIKYYVAITLAITICLTFIKYLLVLRKEKKLARVKI